MKPVRVLEGTLSFLEGDRLIRAIGLSIGIVCAVVGLALPGCSDPEVEAARLQAEVKQDMEQRRFTEAVTPLEKLARLKPESSDIFADLAQCVMRSRNPQDLLKDAETTLKRNPDDAVALTIAVHALRESDDQQKKRDYERRLIKVRPHDILFKFNFAQELVSVHRYEEAYPLVEELVQALPDEAAPYFLRGQVTYYRRANAEGYAAAAGDFQKALERDPHLARANLYLGRVLLRQGKPLEAVATLREGAQKTPGNPDIAFELASAYRKAGDPTSARKAQEEFVRLREQATLTDSLIMRCTSYPNDFALRIKTVGLLLERGDLRYAAFYLRQAQQLRPNDPQLIALEHEYEQLRGRNRAQ